jgi:hypothetical protein
LCRRCQTPFLKWLPADVRKIIEDDGIKAALQFEVDMTKEYIADTYFQEVRRPQQTDQT